MREPRLYPCGPMTGLPEFNYPAFHAAEAELRGVGFDVACPTVGGQVEGWDWAAYMRRGLAQLVRCDGIALLPGWERSPGARFEVEVGERLLMAAQPVGFWIERGAAGVALLAKE